MLSCSDCVWVICQKCENQIKQMDSRHCPQRHVLVEETIKHDELICDVCTMELKIDTLLYTCETCDVSINGPGHNWGICEACDLPQGGGRTLHRMQENDLKDIINDIAGSCGDIFSPVIEELNQNSTLRESAPMLALEAQPRQYNKCKLMYDIYQMVAKQSRT